MNNIGKLLVGAYLLLSQIMSLIFLVQIAKAWDSALAIIFFGPFVAEFQGLLWPFFL